MIIVWGKLAGLALGVFGGVPGVLFGLLLGHLADVVGAEYLLRRATERYLHGSGRRRLSRQFRPPYALAALTLSAVGGRGFTPTPSQRAGFARALLWSLPNSGGARPRPVSADGRRVAQDRGVRRVSAAAVRMASRLLGVIRQHLPTAIVSRVAQWRVSRYVSAATRIDGEIPLDLLGRRLGEWEETTLAQAVIDIAVGIAPPQTSAARERIRSLAHWAGLGDAWTDALLSNSLVLDARACAILGVPRNATLPAVRHAYRTLAAQFHPDTATILSPDQQRASAEAFVRIREAYETLVTELADSGEDQEET